MNNQKLKIRKNIVYSDLSYKIAKILFDTYNNLGSGYQEKYYQHALLKKIQRIIKNSSKSTIKNIS